MYLKLLEILRERNITMPNKLDVLAKKRYNVWRCIFLKRKWKLFYPKVKLGVSRHREQTCVGRRGWDIYGESNMEIYIAICKTDSQCEFVVWSRELKLVLCNNLEGWGVGGRFKRKGTYVYLWLIHADGWQKPTQYCKAIILQLNINVKYKK